MRVTGWKSTTGSELHCLRVVEVGSASPGQAGVLQQPKQGRGADLGYRPYYFASPGTRRVVATQGFPGSEDFVRPPDGEPFERMDTHASPSGILRPGEPAGGSERTLERERVRFLRDNYFLTCSFLLACGFVLVLRGPEQSRVILASLVLGSMITAITIMFFATLPSRRGRRWQPAVLALLFFGMALGMCLYGRSRWGP